MGQCSRRALEARVHLRRRRSGLGARLAVFGPKRGVGMGLGQELEDGEAVPDDVIAGQQRGHLARRRMREDLRLGVGRRAG